MIGIGIIGCGMIARFHAAAVAELPTARLVAVQSRSEANAAHVCQAGFTEAAYYRTVPELLQHPGLDVVIICTPSGNHLEPAQLAAAAGKHVVVEKPLEITLERCDALIAACAQAGVQLCTIFPSRFADANIVLKQAVDAGRFGRLTLGETAVKWWRTQQYYDDGGWKGTQALDGGGALMNQAIHNVDLLQWLMGPVDRISAMTAMLAHERIELEDTAGVAQKHCDPWQSRLSGGGAGRSDALGVCSGSGRRSGDPCEVCSESRSQRRGEQPCCHLARVPSPTVG